MGIKKRRGVMSSFCSLCHETKLRTLISKQCEVEDVRMKSDTCKEELVWMYVNDKEKKIIISFHWCFTIVSVWHTRDTLNCKNEGRMRVMLKSPVLKTRIWFFRPEGPTSPSILFWKEHMTFLNWSSRVLKFERASFWYLFHCDIYYYPSFKNAAKKQWKITYYIC